MDMMKRSTFEKRKYLNLKSYLRYLPAHILQRFTNVFSCLIAVF